MWITLSSEQPTAQILEIDGKATPGYIYYRHEESTINWNWIKRGLVILDRHGAGNIVAFIMAPVLTDDKELAGDAEFLATELGNIYRRDAASGKRRGTSIELQGQPEHEKVVGTYLGQPLVEVSYWQPRCAVFTPIPSDPTVGVSVSPGGRYVHGGGNSEIKKVLSER